jgi:hypothetical protein
MTAGLWPIPARPLPAQVHALHAAAAFIERAGIRGLSLTVREDRITIQVPGDLAGLQARTTAVARLAAAAGGQPVTTADWVTADGDIAGHRVRIFTPARDLP